MSNPKGQFPRRNSPLAAPVDPLDHFLGRLSKLGADDEMLDIIAANWDDPEWENRDQIVALDDPALAREIQAINAEHHNHTVTPEDEAAEAARLATLNADADVARAGNVAAVTEWIGDDQERAEIILRAEMLSDRPRKGVIGYASEVAGDGDAD